MEEHKREEIYPTISYSPDQKWCAFNFNVFFSLYKHDKGFTKLENESPIEELKRYKQIVSKNEKEFLDKFPLTALLQQPDDAENIRRFTTIQEHTHIAKQEEPFGILIYTNIPIYATQLRISVDHTFLQTNIHNGGNANIGLLTVAYGLKALKTIYDAYKLPSMDLPILDFQKEYFKATVPIIHLDGTHHYDFDKGSLQTKKIDIDIKENAIEFIVPFSIVNTKVRTETAFSILEQTTLQAQKNLYLYADQKNL